jgi:hypothetical protein
MVSFAINCIVQATGGIGSLAKPADRIFVAALLYTLGPAPSMAQRLVSSPISFPVITHFGRKLVGVAGFEPATPSSRTG